MNHLEERIFNSKVGNFEELCLAVFSFQYHNNPVYQKFCHLLGITDFKAIKEISKIPFLPVEQFKNKEVKSFEGQAQKIFYSSATSGMGQSAHHVLDLSIYEKSFIEGFEKQFGSINDTCFLGLLPSYLEREGSSLIYMVKHLMEKSRNPLNGFFLYEHETMIERIMGLEQHKKPYYIFGVSFALLDFAPKIPIHLKYASIIETGGMKGRKKEITRQDLLQQLATGFGTKKIFSEFGMTEMMSQAYAGFEGRFQTPPWMQVQIVDPNDPLSLFPQNRTGIIRVIDLANLYSCAFLQTSDLGKLHLDGTFEVLGRIDNSDLRGCSLLLG